MEPTTNDSVPQVEAQDETAEFVNKLFRKGLKHCRKQHDAFKESDKFVDGDQWEPEDVAKLKSENRPTGVFNFVKRHINVVCGVEILNRLQPQFLPRVTDSEMADRLAVLDTGCYDYVMENCDGLYEISGAFRDTVTRGMGFLKERLDLINEPGGTIVWEKIDGKHMVWDPDAFGQENLHGSRYFIYFSRVPKSEAAAEWPDEEDYIRSAAPSDFDDQFGVSAKIEQVVPPPYDPLNKYETDAIDSSGKDHVIIKEAHFYLDEDWTEYIDPFDEQGQSGMKEMKTSKFRTFKRDYEAMYPEKPEVDGVSRKKRVYKRAFVIGGRTMEETDAPAQKGFGIRCMTGEYDHGKKLYRGLPFLLKDPQQMLNKYLSQTQHSIATSPKGILLFEDGAFENYAMAEEQWASWAPFIPMKAGAMGSQGSGKKYDYIPPSQPPQILSEMWQACIKVIEQIAGINLEMLGGGEGEVPGITMRQRQAVAMIAMAGFFNSYRRFLKGVAILTLEMVRKFYTDDRVIRIGGQYDGQAVQLQKDELSYPADVMIDENPRNPNAQEAYYQAAAPLLPGLFKSGAIMQVPSLVDILPLPPKSKAELKKFITQMGQMIAQGGGTPGQKQSGQQQGGKGRDDPRMIQANIENRQAKTGETVAKTQMLQADTNLKRFKAVTSILDASRKDQHERQAHEMDMFSGVHDLQRSRSEHAREGAMHEAELDRLRAATAALRNGGGAGAGAGA